jgi:tRNA(fMet)-specific endonuclease VapC
MGEVKFLLDTNVFSELSKEEPQRRVLSRFHQHRLAVASCAPVLHELQFGVLRMPEGERRERLWNFVNGFLDEGVETLPYDRKAAEIHARERARAAAKGILWPTVDGQIAAIAVANNAALVTRNTSDFRRFPGLRLADWFAA